MIFNHLKVLKSCSLSTQSLASCVNYFCLELFTVFFQHENRFRYKFFRYCSIFKVLCTAALRLTTWLFYHRSGFLSSFIFEKLLKFFELKSFSSFSVLTGTFERSLVLFKGFLLGLQKSFFCLSAWRSSIIPHSRFPVNTFWHLFSNFFAGGQNSNRNEPSQASLHDARFPLLSLAVTFSPGRGKSVLSGRALLALTGRCVKAPPFGGAGTQRLRGFNPILLHYIGSVKPRQV